jgi:hypothetical protein
LLAPAGFSLTSCYRKKYDQVPEWWYLAIFIPCLALSFVTCYVWDTGLTWWALIIAVLISMVWIVPIGMVQAVTNIQIGLNVFTEFIIGYMLPGRPNAMMMFKTYGCKNPPLASTTASVITNETRYHYDARSHVYPGHEARSLP